MSDFFNQIKDNINNFKEPMKQSVENVKDSINDTINDVTPKSNKNNKGCSSKIIILIVIILFISFVYNQCGSDNPEDNVTKLDSQISTTETTSENIPSNNINSNDLDTTEVYIELISNQIKYANDNNIKLCRFPMQEKKLAGFLEKASLTDESDLIFLKIDKDIFKRTENPDEYIYYGELEDNKPNGYGILYKESAISYGAISFDDRYYNRYYFGEFKDGKFDGFGLQFRQEEFSIYDLESVCPYTENDSMFSYYYLLWKNPVEYFGMFSDGERNGKGNYISTYNIENLNPGHNLDELSYSIVEIGEFKGENLDGTGKMYWGGYLQYDGELKNGMMHGKGKQYYFLSDTLEYEGEFKYDERHGYGISYSESGEVVYKGEWAYDDYA